MDIVPLWTIEILNGDNRINRLIFNEIVNALGIALTINQSSSRIRARCCDVAGGV